MFGKALRSALVCGAISLSAAPAIADDNKGIDDTSRIPVYDALKGKRVVFIPLAMGIDLTEGWYRAMKKNGAEFGYDVQVLDPNWNTEAGIRALNTAIAGKADMIVLHNPDIQSYAKLVQRAQKSGSKVVEVGLQSLGGADAAVVGDYQRGGEIGASLIVERCGKGGSGPSNKVAIVLGPPTAANSVFAQRGFWTVVDQHPEIEVVSQQVGNYDPVKIRSIMSTIMQQHPDLCGYMGMWDNADAGAGAAVIEAGKKDQVFIASLSSGGRAMCENVKNGLITAAITYSLPMQSSAINAMIVDRLQSKAPPGEAKSIVFTPATVVTSNNAQGIQCWTPDDIDKL